MRPNADYTNSPLSLHIIFFHLHLFRSKPSRLHSQKTNEQDNQAHNMLSQLSAATDRKVKQQNYI